MKRHHVCLMMTGMLPCLAAGCDALSFLLLPSTVDVVFVNESADYNVEVTIFTDDDENILEVILTTIGDKELITILPGQTVTRTFTCSNLGAIILENADLRTLLLTPDTQTSVFRQDGGFLCGGSITFTFTHTAALTDFAVSTQLQ